MLNRVVDEDCRTDNYGKSEGGSVHEEQQIRNHLASYSPLAAHSFPDCALSNMRCRGPRRRQSIKWGVQLGAAWMRLRPRCPGFTDICNAYEFPCLFSFGQSGDCAVPVSRASEELMVQAKTRGHD